MSAFDEATDQSWYQFTDRLSACVRRELHDGEEFDLTPLGADDDRGPLMQFGLLDGIVDAVVPRRAAGGSSYAIDEVQERALDALGWDKDDDDYFFAVEPDDGEQLAVAAVAVLRAVLGVEHPALLEVRGAESAVQALTVPIPVRSGASVEPAEEDEEPLAVMPRDRDHLAELVDDALTSVFGHAPTKNDDGDIPVRTAAARIYVRVPDDEPAVDLFGSVVLDVRDREAAAREVGILNRDTRYVTFVLRGDQVTARVHVPASPFVPSHLRDLLSVTLDVVADATDDLVARTGGRRAVDVIDLEADLVADAGADAPADAREEQESEEASEDGPGRVPLDRTEVRAVDDAEDLRPELLTLIQLDAAGEGEIEPEVAAAICHYDVDLILGFLRDCEKQSIAWHSSAERAEFAGDPEEAEVCLDEAAAWQVTSALLRSALRVVVASGVRAPKRPSHPSEQTGG
ncbi:T3SS (YopN, CesT) and YbjN peptide-binding chaperone 1 [Mumia sp. DW29H23]|uniref:T3SS (YopN, CesT) and YbjN peptide-binding chaperone 1 n=1 Tax=Mumia sp. DW29H23 TaxID=3421241 RepID=UPI003D68CB11